MCEPSAEFGQIGEPLDERAVLGAFSARTRIVALDFDVSRLENSYSSFERGLPNVTNLSISTLEEQTCLIHHARACVFFTEGDLGSHVYVPPLVGKDVWVVAPPSVFGLPTSPLPFWNEHVFNFGGQIRPVASALDPDAPLVLASQKDLDAFSDRVLAGGAS